MSNKIAIVKTKNPNLITAMKQILGMTIRSVEFIEIDKITDLPEDAALGSIGIPSFIPTSRPVKVYSVGTKQCSNNEERKAQWDVIRSEVSEAEDIIQELGLPDSSVIYSQRYISRQKAKISEDKIAFLEEENPAKKIELLTQAYNKLLDLSPFGDPRKAKKEDEVEAATSF